NKHTCRWRVLGDAAEVHVSSQRAKIIAVLKEAGLAMTIPALMEATGMKRNPLEVLLGRMATKGEIRRIGKGLYAHLDYVSAPDDPPPAKPDSTWQEQARHASPTCPVIEGPDRYRDRSAASANAGNNRTKSYHLSICPICPRKCRYERRSCFCAGTDRSDR